MSTKFKNLAIKTKFTFSGYGAVYTKVSERKAAYRGRNTTVRPESDVIALEVKTICKEQIRDGETVIVNSTITDWPVDIKGSLVERIGLLV